MSLGDFFLPRSNFYKHFQSVSERWKKLIEFWVRSAQNLKNLATLIYCIVMKSKWPESDIWIQVPSNPVKLTSALVLYDWMGFGSKFWTRVRIRPENTANTIVVMPWQSAKWFEMKLFVQSRRQKCGSNMRAIWRRICEAGLKIRKKSQDVHP